jgi:hypothetical protein
LREAGAISYMSHVMRRNLAILALVPAVAIAAPKPPAAAHPPAGEYKCYVLAMGGSIATPYGAAPMVTPMPSAIDHLRLDGKNGYKHASGNGKYRYDPSTGHLIVESGPFAGWAIRSETDGKTQWLRFAAKKGAPLEPTSRIGDHICSIG